MPPLDADAPGVGRISMTGLAFSGMGLGGMSFEYGYFAALGVFFGLFVFLVVLFVVGVVYCHAAG